MTTYEQERVGDYIGLYSGRNFYVLDPRVEDVTVEDVAHSLSNICRFTGHGERFYSVAEHSIHCSLVAEKLGMSPLMQMYALFHDASESIVNDLARPVKQNIPEYKEIEDKIMKVMWELAGVPEPTREDYMHIKKIDNTLLLNEMKVLTKHLTLPDVEHYKVYVQLIKGYSAGKKCKYAFLERFQMVKRQIELEEFRF